jgi:hypothetical protein
VLGEHASMSVTYRPDPSPNIGAPKGLSTSSHLTADVARAEVARMGHEGTPGPIASLG